MMPMILSMVKYDGEKWLAETDEEKEGYGLDGTLLRQGPIPAIKRVFQPDDYEQAVLKFMASEKCDRNTAQANMDAYQRNPNDWLYTRMQDEKRGTKTDFLTVQPKGTILFYLWSAIVLAVAGNAFISIANGDLDMGDILFVRIPPLR